jgi:hypothetical protein
MSMVMGFCWQNDTMAYLRLFFSFPKRNTVNRGPLKRYFIGGTPEAHAAPRSCLCNRPSRDLFPSTRIETVSDAFEGSCAVESSYSHLPLLSYKLMIRLDKAHIVCVNRGEAKTRVVSGGHDWIVAFRDYFDLVRAGGGRLNFYFHRKYRDPRSRIDICPSALQHSVQSTVLGGPVLGGPVQIGYPSLVQIGG